MSPPLTPDADSARQQLADELAKPTYADVGNWIAEQFNKLLDWLIGSQNSTGSLSSGQLAMVVGTIVLLAAAAIWASLRSGRVARRKQAGVLGEEDRSAADLRADATRLAAGADWTGACLQLFRATVRSLGERVVIEEFPGMTAHEAAGLAAVRLPDFSVQLTGGADLFDALAYGRRPGTAEQYDTLCALDAEVAAARPTPLASALAEAAVRVVGG